MNAATLYTRKYLGLDYRVWLSMVITCFICLGLMGYKHIKSSSTTSQPCAANLSIAVNGRAVSENAVICYMNQMALFRINTAPGVKVKWNFGDGSTPVEGRIAPHTFTKENTFTIEATVNGSCKYKQVVIVQRAPLASVLIPEIKIFSDSNKVTAGGQLRFSVACNFNPETYEWKVSGSRQVQNGQVATFSFPNPGMYAVQVKLDNDSNKVSTYTVEVIAPPVQFPMNNGFPGGANSAGSGGNPVVPGQLLGPGDNPFEQNGQGQKKPGTGAGEKNPGGAVPEPAKQDSVKAIETSPETFMVMLQAVLEGDKDISELYPFLDYKESTFVQKEGSDEQIKLPVFCRKNAGRKIEGLIFQRDNKNGIQVIKIKIRRRGPFGIFGD